MSGGYISGPCDLMRQTAWKSGAMIQGPPVRRAAFWAALLIAIPAFLAMQYTGPLLSLYQVQSQDAPVLLCLPVLLLCVGFFSPDLSLPTKMPSSRLLLACGLTLVLLLGWGSYRLMGNFPLSRDEHMVVFDMAVFSKGQFAAPLSPEWRDYARALVPDFLLNSDHPIGLVSDYLPVNAMLRLGFAQIADPAFFNPLLVLIGGIALFDIARRLFEEDVRARWVVLLIYGLSAQILAAAMTTYAMTAHMALNLVWLAAFLRGGKAGHAVAIAVALLAVGLHQVVFHPLFAAPFLLWRLRQGQWKVVLIYGAAYLAILGWWTIYPLLVTQLTGVTTSGQEQNGNILGKIIELLLRRDNSAIALMLLNLLRFFAWQNLALLPLLIAAAPLCLQGRTLAAPLFWGIGGLILLVSILLPYQGHGWGYRYLHPFLGSFALLAGFGYQRLAEHMGRRADGMVLTLSGLTLCLSLPWLLWTTYGFVTPHVALEQVIARQTAKFVIIDTEILPSTNGQWMENAVDHVRNSPDLSNAPLRLSSRNLTPQMLSQICRRGTVSAVTHADMRKVGFAAHAPMTSPEFAKLMDSIKGQSCVRPLDPRATLSTQNS